MKIMFDVAGIDHLLNDLKKISGTNFTVFDKNMVDVAFSKFDTKFCNAVRCTKEGAIRCLKCDEIIHDKCIKKGQAVSQICHAGLMDTIVPIMSDTPSNEILGFITFGQYAVTDDFESVYKRVADIMPDKELTRKYYNELLKPDEKYVEAILRILDSVIKYTLIKDYINISSDTLIQSVTDYISDNLSDDISSDKICELFHISRSTLYRKFSESRGCSLNEFIINQRMSRAASLLRTTQLSVQDISESVGIKNYYYFFKLFKKTTGETPLAYRKSYGKK